MEEILRYANGSNQSIQWCFHFWVTSLATADSGSAKTFQEKALTITSDCPVNNEAETKCVVIGGIIHNILGV